MKVPTVAVLLASAASKTALMANLQTPATKQPQEVKITSVPSSHCTLLIGLNYKRASVKLGPCYGDVRLDEAAAEQCIKMAKYGVLQHQIGYSKPSTRVVENGYGYSRVGENILREWGKGVESPERANEEWWNSPGHKANMMGDFTAVGYASCKASNGLNYYAQVFGKGDDDANYKYTEASCRLKYPSGIEHKEVESAEAKAPKRPATETQQVPEAKRPFYGKSPATQYVDNQMVPILNAPYRGKENVYSNNQQKSGRVNAIYRGKENVYSNNQQKSGEVYSNSANPQRVSHTLKQKTLQPSVKANVSPESKPHVRYGPNGLPCKATSYGNKSYGKKAIFKKSPASRTVAQTRNSDTVRKVSAAY